MSDYNEESTCPKCGNTWIDTQYKTHGLYATVEYILRRCMRCGYEWQEETLDSKDKIEAK